MKAEGFTRVIQSDQGVWYQLPTGMYYGASNAEQAVVIQAAKRAAGKTGYPSGVVVIESNGAIWNGLTVVDSAMAR